MSKNEDQSSAPEPVSAAHAVAAQAVSTLNEFLNGDPEACESLLTQRVPVNQATLDHPFIVSAEVKGKSMVGMLGILNGILYASSGLKVASMHGDGDKLVGFQLYTPREAKKAEAPKA